MVIIVGSWIDTWSSAIKCVKPEELLQVPRGVEGDGLGELSSEVNAATSTVRSWTSTYPFVLVGSRLMVNFVHGYGYVRYWLW